MIRAARRRTVVAVLAIALMLPSIANAAPNEPSSATGLEVGRWVASSVLEGVNVANLGGADIDYTGRFDTSFEFDVDTSGAAAGSWTATGDSTMVLAAPSGTATLQTKYVGGGELLSIGNEVIFAGTTSRSGVMSAGGRSIPVADSEFDPGMTIDITGSSCEEAWGAIDLSIEERSAEIGFTTDWVGPWFAVEQGTEGDERPDFIPGLNQIAADHEHLLAGFGTDDLDATAVPAVWDLINRALPILNEIRNLGECARRYFDPNELEWWETMLSAIVRNSILVIVSSTDVDGYELLALVDAGLAANAFGPNLPQPDLTADALAALQQRAEEIIQEMIVPDGTELPEGVPCDNGGRGCMAPDSWDQMSALVAAKKMGWSVELPNGDTRTASSIIDQWGAQGLDVELGVSETATDDGG